MKRIALTFIAVMTTLAHPALAFDKTFSWTVPTARTDGSALAFTDIKQYQLYRVNAEQDVLVATVEQPAAETDKVSYTLTNVEAIGEGSYDFYVVAVDSNGLTSYGSNRITVITAKPTPPTLSVN